MHPHSEPLLSTVPALRVSIRRRMSQSITTMWHEPSESISEKKCRFACMDARHNGPSLQCLLQIPHSVQASRGRSRPPDKHGSDVIVCANSSIVVSTVGRFRHRVQTKPECAAGCCHMLFADSEASYPGWRAQPSCPRLPSLDVP